MSLVRPRPLRGLCPVGLHDACRAALPPLRPTRRAGEGSHANWTRECEGAARKARADGLRGERPESAIVAFRACRALGRRRRTGCSLCVGTGASKPRIRSSTRPSRKPTSHTLLSLWRGATLRRDEQRNRLWRDVTRDIFVATITATTGQLGALRRHLLAAAPTRALLAGLDTCFEKPRRRLPPWPPPPGAGSGR